MVKDKPKETKTDDKNGGLEALLSELQEKYGEGAIMKLGDSRHMDVAAISTGSFSLDIALGIGGLPKGRVVEVFGPESSGKCINRNSMVFSEQGMLPIDAFGRLAIPGFQKKNLLVYAEHSYEKTSHFYNDGLKKTVVVGTRKGFRLEGTPNHRIRILDREGNYLFRRLDELRSDDRVAIQRGQNFFGRGVTVKQWQYQKSVHDHSSKLFRTPAIITPSWGYLMGYLVGDGTITNTGLNKNNIQLTAGDSEAIADFSRLCRTLFGETPKVTKDKRTAGTYRLVIYNARARSFLKYIGLGWGRAAEKEIPWSVLCAPKQVVSAFLSALFECDGCFSGAAIEYCTQSEKLADQLQIVLLNYGIVAKKKPRMVNDTPYYYLYIEGQKDKRMFAEQIGFRSSRKMNLLRQYVAQERMPQTNVDTIPYVNTLLDNLFRAFGVKVRKTNRADWKLLSDYLPRPRGKGCGLSYDRLKRVLSRFRRGRNLPQYQQLEELFNLGLFFDKIETIKKSMAHVVDFTLPKTATFFANGFVNHNTTLALNVVAQSQKKGGKCAFIDAEHALDPEYAARLGVNAKELLVSQPDNGEDALNILESLVRSNIIDVVVVDSVAALTPKAEIEGAMGAQFIGLQARLMSQALRKLTAITSRSNTLIVFINQIRMQIGIPFGNPETTPGGKALKFYASVRIDVRRIAQIKKGEEVIGSRVKAKVVKNKVAPPFRLAEFDIMYNEGISYEADVLNAGLRYGLVKKSGASFSFGDIKLGVGFDTIRLKLKEDKKLLKELETGILKTISEKID